MNFEYWHYYDEMADIYKKLQKIFRSFMMYREIFN